MFEQNGLSAPSIRSHNPPNRPLPIREVESHIPSQDPEEKIEKKEKQILLNLFFINTIKYIELFSRGKGRHVVDG